MAWLTASDLGAFDEGMANRQSYSDDLVESVIADAEADIERIVGVAYDRRVVTDEWHLGDGGAWLRLNHRWPVSVSAASIDGTSVSPTKIDRQTGHIYLASGWTCGAEILISYVHGHFTTTVDEEDVTTYTAAVPTDLLRAAKIYCRALLAERTSPVIDRSTAWTPDGGGGFFRIAQPTASTTGVPAVDAILARYLVPGMA